MPLLSDSDAHTSTALGRYFNELEEPATSEEHLAALLRAGRFEPQLIETAVPVR